MAPAVVRVDGELRLVHELHMTNFASGDAALKRIEVLDGDGSVLGDLREATLTSALGRPGGLPECSETRLLTPGARVVANFWLALARDRPAPRRIRRQTLGS